MIGVSEPDRATEETLLSKVGGSSVIWNCPKNEPSLNQNTYFELLYAFKTHNHGLFP